MLSVGLLCGLWASADAGCDALLGEWQWFTGGSVRLERDHRILYNGQAAGEWNCVSDASGEARLSWRIGTVDSVRVHGDQLSGSNSQGVAVTAERRAAAPRPNAAPPPTATPAAAPSAPAASAAAAGAARVPHPPQGGAPNLLQRCLGVATGQRWPEHTGPRPDTLKDCQQLPAWSQYETAHQAFASGQHADAAQRLLAAARAGNALAAARLAIMYDRGDGVARDKQAAFRWYAAAAQAGDPGAAGELGSFYEAGDAGVAEDWVEAARWYRDGAQFGWHKAEESLGRAYQYGIGVPLDLRQAIQWYERAAAGGNSQARYFAQYLKDNHGFDASTMSDAETALYGTLPRTLGHTVAPPAGTVFHNKAERLGYIRAGLVRIAWQEYDDCRRAALAPGEQRSCYPPTSPRP